MATVVLLLEVVALAGDNLAGDLESTLVEDLDEGLADSLEEGLAGTLEEGLADSHEEGLADSFEVLGHGESHHGSAGLEIAEARNYWVVGGVVEGARLYP